ncbi:MAG TPA: methyltransferase domain-containing protein [Acidimicrobiales bacterium]|nr:methyltransferase domain-containing protein [Acidimicrobiales bacterium]
MASSSDYEPLQALPALAGVVDRRDLLVAAARGRRVVHLGCVDDRLTEVRLDAGLLLHARLGAVATHLVGVDISAPGIALLEERVPGEYRVGDVQDLASVPLPDDVEVVIASELIEHLPSPGLFLVGLRELLASRGATALITTPNAYGWVAAAKLALRRREPTHPDHVLVYSPYTLVHAVEAAGLRVDAFWMHDWRRPPGLVNRLRGSVAALVRRWNPYLSPGLVVRVSAAGDATTR